MLTSISTQDVLLLACNTIPYHPISKHIIHLEIDYISCFDQKKQKPIKAQAKDSVWVLRAMPSIRTYMQVIPSKPCSGTAATALLVLNSTDCQKKGNVASLSGFGAFCWAIVVLWNNCWPQSPSVVFLPVCLHTICENVQICLEWRTCCCLTTLVQVRVVVIVQVRRRPHCSCTPATTYHVITTQAVDWRTQVISEEAPSSSEGALQVGQWVFSCPDVAAITQQRHNDHVSLVQCLSATHLRNNDDGNVCDDSSLMRFYWCKGNVNNTKEEETSYLVKCFSAKTRDLVDFKLMC